MGSFIHKEQREVYQIVHQVARDLWESEDRGLIIETIKRAFLEQIKVLGWSPVYDPQVVQALDLEPEKNFMKPLCLLVYGLVARREPATPVYYPLLTPFD
jgi:hypothetical protein